MISKLQKRGEMVPDQKKEKEVSMNSAEEDGTKCIREIFRLMKISSFSTCIFKEYKQYLSLCSRVQYL